MQLAERKSRDWGRFYPARRVSVVVGVLSGVLEPLHGGRRWWSGGGREVGIGEQGDIAGERVLGEGKRKVR